MLKFFLSGYRNNFDWINWKRVVGVPMPRLYNFLFDYRNSFIGLIEKRVVGGGFVCLDHAFSPWGIPDRGAHYTRRHLQSPPWSLTLLGLPNCRQHDYTDLPNLHVEHT